MSKLRSQHGSALLLVLVALLLITSLYSAVVLYGSYHRRLALQDVMDTQAYYLAESGVEAALSKLNQEADYRLAFYQDVGSNESFEVNIKPFGAYLLCESKGKAGTRTKTIRCLIGVKPEDKFKNAINLGGQDYPLTLAGKTTITGDVLVSPSGVLPGRFKGKRFGGNQLVNGEIFKSPGERLPHYDRTIINQFLSEINRMDFNSSKEIDKTFVLDDASKINIEWDSLIDFKANLIINVTDKPLDLTAKYYNVDGNLSITGDSRIYGYGIIDVKGEVQIDSECNLKDLIILANRDLLLTGKAVYGGQLIANAKIEIDQEASLDRNAVVICLGEIDEEERCFYLRSSGPSQGVIISDLENTNANKLGHRNIMKTVDLSPSCKFNGVIFNTGYSRISGFITGNLSTGSLYIFNSPTIFINWLVDATVISKDNLTTIPAVFGAGASYAKVNGL